MASSLFLCHKCQQLAFKCYHQSALMGAHLFADFAFDGIAEAIMKNNV